MKVYTCWAGQYSDRVMYAIFSTKKAAEEFIRRNLATANRYDDYDNEPEEYEMDEVRKYNDHVTCKWMNTDENLEWVMDMNSYDCGELHDTLIIKSKCNYYYITVNFNYDRSVMEKAARDKLNMLLARDEGI